MTTYLCRSRDSRVKRSTASLNLKSRSTRAKRTAVNTSLKRSKRLSSKRIIQLPMQVLRRAHKSKFIRLSKSHIFASRKIFSRNVVAISRLGLFKSKYQQALTTRFVFSRYLTNKVYRNFNIYDCWNFRNLKIKRAILKISYNSRSIHQDASYLIFNKADLSKFGLIPKEDNSVDEIIYYLLSFWSANLEPARISVIFYQYIKVEEDSQWLEIKSFLINFLVTNETFPSPNSFSI